MRYYIDTEFHEHQKPVKFLGFTIAKVWTIDLISIGIVCEDGREYYAINRDLNLKHAKKNKWLKENVLDKLPPKQPEFPIHGGSPRLYQETMRWIPMKQIAEEILDFVGAKIDTDDFGNWFYSYNREKPEFYAYYADYDWVVFCWIFGTMMQLPNGFPMYCKDIKQMFDERLHKANGSIDIVNDRIVEYGNKKQQLEYYKSLSNYPKETNAHNALDDARWNKNLYEFVIRIS